MKLTLTKSHWHKRPMKKYQRVLIIDASIDDAKQIRELLADTATLYADVTIRINLIRPTKAWN